MISLDSLLGSTVRATDGEIGRVADFLFDDEAWAVRYVVADTGDCFAGRVLLSPYSVDAPLTS